MKLLHFVTSSLIQPLESLTQSLKFLSYGSIAEYT